MADQILDRMSRRSDLGTGVLRGTVGPLAKVPISDLIVLTATSGSGSCGPGARTEQQDGGAVFYSVTSSAAGTPNAAALGTVFRGTAFGVRVRVSTNTTQGPFDLIVNGRCVPAAESTLPVVNGLTTGTYTDWETPFLFPYILKDRRHTGYIAVGPNPDGVTVNQTPANGWLLSRTDGYRDVSPTPRKGRTGTLQTPTTTAAALFSADASTLTVALRFKSTDASARTITIYRETGIGAGDVYDILTIPAGAGTSVGAYVYTLARPMNTVGYRIKVDSGSTITFWEEYA